MVVRLRHRLANRGQHRLCCDALRPLPHPAHRCRLRKDRLMLSTLNLGRRIEVVAVRPGGKSAKLASPREKHLKSETPIFPDLYSQEARPCRTVKRHESGGAT